MQLLPWSEIKDDFRETLIVGNGASIAIDPKFRYQSLLEEALKKGWITPSIQKVFQYFDNTKDFEFILSRLYHAHHVNLALGVSDNDTEQAYKDVQQALIRSVKAIHPEYGEAKHHIERIWHFMKQFDKIVSLNYDLLLYWAMLRGNEHLRGTWFKDCFKSGSFDLDWKSYEEPHFSARGVTLVFYLHGNLALGTDRWGQEIKLARSNSDNLLSQVTEAWEHGVASPLFVSEGESKQKEKSIRRSPYLSTIYDEVLPKLGSSLVILGWSLSDNDLHILNAISIEEIKKVAVSVLRGVKNDDEIGHKCEKTKLKLEEKLNRTIEVVFFDVESHGCWVNA